MSNFLDSLISPENKEAKADATYLYIVNFLAIVGVFENQPLDQPVLVCNVVKRANGSYTFNIQGKPEVLYVSNYGWAFILNTPENLSDYEAVVLLEKERAELEKRIQEARKNVSTLSNVKTS